MGKATNRKAPPPVSAQIKGWDANPERLAKGEGYRFDEAAIEKAGDKLGKVRRFTGATRLDKWHARGIITRRQFDAGDWYRIAHYNAISEPRLIASYGEAVGGGSDPDYGMARSMRQYRARKTFRAARESIPTAMVGFIDRLIIHDSLPHYRGRAQMHTFKETRKALDALAEYLWG